MSDMPFFNPSVWRTALALPPEDRPAVLVHARLDVRGSESGEFRRRVAAAMLVDPGVVECTIGRTIGANGARR